MGYWPSKIAAVCNIIQQVGFGTIGCIITGQMITAVNGGSLSLAVGCVIAALCIGLVATFGITYLNKIERQVKTLVANAQKAYEHTDSDTSHRHWSSSCLSARLVRTLTPLQSQ